MDVPKPLIISLVTVSDHGALYTILKVPTVILNKIQVY